MLVDLGRVLSIVSTIFGLLTVIGLLVSVQPLLLLLVVLAAVPGVVTAASVQARHRLFKDTERYRRLATTVSEVLRAPAQAVETRCFRLGPTLSEVARCAYDSYAFRFNTAARKYAVLTGLVWVAFGIAYMAAGWWMFVRVRRGSPHRAT